MKGLKDFILDDSPKAAKKLEKIFAKDPESGAYFEQLKAEVNRPSAQEFPKFRIIITDSFVCFSRLMFGGSLEIIPLSQITNIYRTNIVRGGYDYENFTLAAETANGIRYLSVYPRTSAKSLDVFNEVIDAVRAKIAVNGGALL